MEGKDTTVDARFRMHLDRPSAFCVVPVTLEVRGAHHGWAMAERSGPPCFKQEDRWFILDLAGWHAIVAQVPELSLVATLGSFDVTVPHEHSAAWRLILVLRKVGGALPASGAPPSRPSPAGSPPPGPATPAR